MVNHDLLNTAKYNITPLSPTTKHEYHNSDFLAHLSTASLLPKSIKIKTTTRKGIPNALRSTIWVELLKPNLNLPLAERSYLMGLERTFGPHAPTSHLPYPSFGSLLHFENTSGTKGIALNAKGVFKMEALLCILGHDFPHLEFCPFIPALGAVLLHQVNVDDVLGMLTVLIKTSLEEKEWSFFPTRLKDTLTFIQSFGELLSKQNIKLYKRIVGMQESHQFPLWGEWFVNFFIGSLPLTVIVRIMDSFLVEGYKTMYRFAMAMILLRKTRILEVNSIEELRALFVEEMWPYTADELAKIAYKIKFSRNQIEGYKRKKEVEEASEMTGTEGFLNLTIPKIPQIDKEILTSELSRHVTFEHWNALWNWLPKRFQVGWMLKEVFTSREHGYRLQTLYEMSKVAEPLVLIIETCDDEVFGAFLPSRWPEGKERAGNSFYGTGETFLFSFLPRIANYGWQDKVAHRAKLKKSGSSRSLHSLSKPASMNISELNLGVSVEKPTRIIKTITETVLHKFTDIQKTSDLLVKEASVKRQESLKRVMSLKRPDQMQMRRDTSKRDTMYIIANKKYIGFGGGGNGYGLWIDESLTFGTTAHCNTFNNVPLVGNWSDLGREYEFEIRAVDVFTLTLK